MRRSNDRPEISQSGNSDVSWGLRWLCIWKNNGSSHRFMEDLYDQLIDPHSLFDKGKENIFEFSYTIKTWHKNGDETLWSRLLIFQVMRTILTNQKLLNHNCSRNMGANLFGSYRCLQAFSFHFEDIKGLWLPLSPHQKKFGLPWWCLSSPERISWKPFDLYSPQSSGLQSLDQMKTGRGGQLGNGTDTCWEWIDVKIEFDKKSQSSESGGGKIMMITWEGSPLRSVTVQ